MGRLRATLSADDLLAAAPSKANIVALSSIANHDNMGGIFRNAAAFGAYAVLLDSGCCDPLNREAIRVSVGATLLVAHAKLAPDQDLLTLLRGHAFARLALSPTGAVPFGAAGARRPQRRLAGRGVAVVARGIAYFRDHLGTGTNSDAEWLALLMALAVAQQIGAEDVVLVGDAAHVINQANGLWRCRRVDLQRHLDEFRLRVAAFSRVRVRHVGRHQNLAGIALEHRRAGSYLSPVRCGTLDVMTAKCIL